MPTFAHLPLILKPAPENFINKRNRTGLAERFAREIVQKNPETPGLTAEVALREITQLLQDTNSLGARLKLKNKDPELKKTIKTFLRASLYGKLSKRDGDRLGMPVFPLSWQGAQAEDSFLGFREAGFLPAAVVNFLAFLGWNPGTEQEIFTLDELIDAFSLDKIGKSGARFNYDKARWYDQQYLLQSTDAEVAAWVRPFIEAHGHQPSEAYLLAFIQLMKERSVVLTDFWENGRYFFEPVTVYDEAGIRKRYKPERRALFDGFVQQLSQLEIFDAAQTKAATEAFMAEHELKFGDVLPILRLGVAGNMHGPDLFSIMALLGQDEVIQRLETGLEYFDRVHAEG